MSPRLDDYSYQPLPDLGTGSRHPPEGRGRVELSYDPGDLTGIYFRASFAKVLLLYLDSNDFLFADGLSTRVPFRAKTSTDPKAPVSFEAFARDLEEQVRTGHGVDEEEVASSWGMKPGQDPFPAVFHRDESLPANSISSPLVLHANPATNIMSLHYSTSLLAEHSADILLNQIHQTWIFFSSTAGSASPITTPLSLPRSLMSAYEPLYDDSKAVLTLSWLMTNARERPDGIAHEIYTTHGLDHPPDILTYKDLNEGSNRLARWLIRRRGLVVGRQDRVAVCRNRDVNFYTAHAGIWKAGGCYVSIDPDLPPERKRYIASDSEALLVITTSDQASVFGERAVVLDDPHVQDEINAEDDSEDVCHAELDQLAYLLYTSGTTGTPKGCLLNHRGLYWAIEAMCLYPAKVTDPSTDKRLALASIAFDVHISEITQTWRLGIRLVSGQRYELLADLKGVITGIGITHLGMVPSMIEATLTGEEEKLKYLVSGGEKMSDSLLKKWANHPRVILANFYGPTEATVGCTSRRVSPTDRKENIGKPFESCHAYIVDPKNDLKMVPRGTPGELLVCGPLVGVGYIGLPQVTKKVFVEYEGKRGYRTGDLVRMMPDGSLEIMGRIDTQIKLRGVRIEAEGVSNVLRSALDVEVDAATMIATHPELSASSELLVSFVAIHDSSITFQQRRTQVPPLITTEEMKATVKRMKNAAEKELAVYMRPSYIVPLGWLPLSMNGKVEARVLKSLFGEMSVKELVAMQGGAGGYATTKEKKADRAPTGTELRVLDIIRKFYNDDKVSLSYQTNLFECGFDSLRFATLAGELRKKFSVRIEAAEVMERPVVEDVAARLASAMSEDQDESKAVGPLVDKAMVDAAEAVFSPSDIDVVLPLFPVQEGVLFKSMESPDSYVQHFVYRCAEGVDAGRVMSSWRAVLGRQQILRTVFVTDDTGALIQVVLRDGTVDVPGATTKIHLDEGFDGWFLRSEALNVSTRINEDLTTPLWAVNIYEDDSSDQSSYMVFSINHALYDGNAMPLLIKEFRAIYSSPTPAPLLPDPVPLSSVLSAIPPANDPHTKQFFLDHFATIKHRDATPIAREVDSEKEAVWMTYPLDGISLGDLKDKCNRDWHVTLQAFWAVAFAIAGREFFGWNLDAIFGVVRSGRSLPLDGIENAICPLVTVVPTHVAFENPNEMLKKTQGFVGESSKYEHVSLGQVQRWLGVKNLIDVLLSCRFDGGVKQKNIVEHLASSRAIPEFVFNMEMVMNPVADSVEARLSFITPQLPQEKVDSFLHRFEECVESLISGHESGLQLNLENGEPTLPLTSPEASLGSSDRPVDHKLESLLTNAVAEFLRVDVSSIHPTTSLTALGLSSIRAVSLGRVLTEQGIKVSAVDIIQADGIREIARRVVGVSTKDDSRAVQESIRWLASFKEQLLADLELSKLKLTEDDGLDISGCTALQTGMLAQTLNSGGQLYVHAFTCQLLPECDPQHLRAAWQSAVEQLDILRTSFHFVSSVGQWAQVVHSRSDFKWTSRNLTGSLDDIRSQFISSLSFKDETTFARPPVHFLHLMGSENYLIIVLHHALYDGIAIPKLFRRVRRLYRDLDVPSPVKFLPIADAILMQEKGGTKYWTSQLEGSRPCQIPRVSSTSGSEAAWRSSVSLNLSAGELRRFCRRYHVHPQCLGQAAWAKVLARKVGSPDVVFGQVISGRTLPDADDVIGPVFNTIPCRVAFTPRETNKQLVRSIHEWNTSGLPWQHASLRSIQRQLGTSNLFDTLFLYQPHSDVIADDPLWATVGRGEMQESKTQYAINVELHERADSFHIFASCASDVATHEGLVSLLNDLNDEFVQLVRMPNAAVLGAEDPLFSSNQSAPDTPTTKVEDIEDDSVMNSWTDEQHQLRKIIVDFVRLPPDAVTPATSLVSIGIDSICAIQVASLARRAGISISATQVARSTSVQELVSVLSSSRPEAVDRTHNLAVPAIPEKVASNVRSSLPSGIRDRIEQILPPSAGMIYYTATEAHANAFTYKVERSEDPGAISRRVRDTWRDLSLKHKILRSFLWETGEQEFRMVLCVSKTYDFEWTEFTIDSTDELAAVRQQARTLTSVPIVSDRPSTRLALLHGKRASYMIVSLHHAQYDPPDGWSLPLLMKEFESFYSGEQATDVGGDVESFLGACSRDSGSLSEQETYWKQLFPSSYEPTLFPRSNLESRPSFLSLVRQFVGCFQSPQETQTLVFVSMTGLVKSLDRLQSKARTHNLPLQSILLACWALIQARWSSIDSSTFLLCHAGRSGIVPDVDVLAAPTVNYIPTRVVLARDKEDIVAIAKQIQNELSGRSPVVEQSRVSDIARWAGKPGEPLTNISVNVLRLPGNGGTEEAKEKPARIFQPVKFPYSARPSETNSGAKAFPEIQHDCQVEMYFHSSTNSIGMSIECKSELMSERQAEDVCREWGRLVENFGSS
ncbi:Non-ribosomal peptide synthetase [Marasmius crinis-equi]|uniref:Non-ribosomal peptide synthetase n=1 Tax=Marasmius crinis-equi TaxID=585013 RepID=A0ABR3FSX5_9AGAR